VGAAETRCQPGVLVVIIQTGTVRHLVWELGREAPEGSSEGQDGLGVVVIVDVSDEVAARCVGGRRMIDDVDLAEDPEVPRWRVDRLGHD